MADGGVWTKIYPDVASLGGGKVLQVVRAKSDDFQSTTSTDYIEVPGMEVTIKPLKTDSCVLVIAVFLCESYWNTDNDGRSFFRITLDDLPLDKVGNFAIGPRNLTGTDTRTLLSSASLFALDQTLSDVERTYQLQYKSITADVQTRIRNEIARGQIYAIEIADVKVSP